ncbi:MAG: hypothetical protein K0S07_1515 [Chlamydiales bacterium]|jgi:flagellar basal body-associated protein FliL|nr:hypothetical protein [Chlamydiales bacterium]
MAENENQSVEAGAVPKPPKSQIPLIVLGVIVLVALIAGFWIFRMKEPDKAPKEDLYVEYAVPERIFQLKDGGYLRLGFSIVLKQKQLDSARKILETDSPAMMPAGINLIVADKTRAELIDGMQKREALAREIKKMIEERVFGEYNRSQGDSNEMIDVREVLISNFVTQSA